MSATATHGAGAESAEDTTRGRIARDLLLLADLHDHEPDRAAVVALWARCYDGLLEVSPYGPAVRDAVNRFSESLTEIPTCFDKSAGAALLADFRRVCLSGTDQDRAGESAGSKSDTDDLPIEGEAMHRWASLRGIAADSGRRVDGSGLAVRLRQLAYLVAADGIAAPVETLQRYLDERLLRCVDRFVAEVAAHSGTHFFQELGVLTAAYVHELGQRCANRALDWPYSPDRQPRTATAPRVFRQGGLRHTPSAAGIPWDGQRSA